MGEPSTADMGHLERFRQWLGWKLLGASEFGAACAVLEAQHDLEAYKRGLDDSRREKRVQRHIDYLRERVPVREAWKR